MMILPAKKPQQMTLQPPLVEPTAGQPTDVVSQQASQPSEELSGGQKLKKWFVSVKRKDGRIHGSPMQKVALGAVVAAGAWTATKMVADLASSPSIGIAVGKAALDVAGLGAGWLAGDVVSGLMHHWSENYAKPDSGPAIARKIAKQAHRHHYHPAGLGDYTLSAWAFPHSMISWAPLVAGNLLNLPSPVMAAALTTVAATSSYGLIHMWSHKRDAEVPSYIRGMRKVGLAMTRKDHAEHHGKPWNTDYCMVTPHMNRLFDKIDFWPKYEKGIHTLLKVEPDSWKIKDYKAFANGEISKQEYISRASSVGQDFKTEIFQVRKPKWGID
jgi:ubiquitin-conjugating enzyme E2 variant